MANRFLNNITINDEYTLPSADGTADQIITTDGSGQLSFVDQNTINAGNAEHVVVYAKNTSGASISKGTPVYITGTVGATDTVEIAPADAGNSAKMPAVGLLDDTLANNAFGYVITGGFMDNIPTDPIDGATPSSNDTVYVKSGGGLTLTKPTGSNLIQNVAKVGKVSGGNSGSLIVSSILRTNDVPNLTTGKIWVGDGNTVESTVVHLDEVNERMGIGTTSPSEKLEVNGGNLIVNDGTSKSRLRSTDLYMQQGGVIKAWLRADGNSYLNGGNLGIGTTAPGAKLDIVGSGGIGLRIKKSDLSDVFRVYSNGAGIYANNGNFHISDNLGIGTTSPSEKLDVNGNIKLNQYGQSIYFGSTVNEIKGSASDFLYKSFSRVQWDNAGTYTDSSYVFKQSGSEVFRIDTGGNVGIGTTNPGARLEVAGAPSSDYAPLTSVSLTGKTGSGTGWTGTSVLTGYTHSPGNSDPLVTNIVPIANTKYIITLTISGITTGRYERIVFGGTIITVYINQNFTKSVACIPVNTDPLEVIAQPGTDGSISIDSISQVGARDSAVNISDSSGSVRNEIRSGHSATSMYIGAESGKYLTSTFNVNNMGVGYATLKNNISGTANTTIGYANLNKAFATSYMTTLGYNNFPHYSNPGNAYSIGIGTNVATSTNMTGGLNILLGNNMFMSATTANGNMAMGYSTLRNVTTGSKNVSLGVYSLFSTTTGSGNIALGQHTLYSKTTGNYNLAIGDMAGRYLGGTSTGVTQSNNSIFLGFKAGPNGDSQTNQIVIGHNAIGAGSNTATIGATTITKTILNGNVGIGTTNPNSILHIADANPEFILEDTTNLNRCRIKNNDGNLRFEADYNSQLGNSRHLFFIDGSEKLRINTNGNVGIGTTNPSEKLHVEGDMNLYNPSSTSQINFRNIAGANYIKSNGYSTHFGLRGNTGNGVFIIENSLAAAQDIRIKPTTSGWDFSSRGVAGVNALLTIDSVLNVSNKTNVGIGTTAPSYPLVVARTGSNIVASFEGNENTYLRIARTGTQPGEAQLRVTNNGSLDISSDSNISLKTGGTSGTARVYIRNSDGKVGIGTTSPGTKLHVSGDGALNATSTQSLLRLERPFNSGVSFAQGADIAIGRGNTYPSTQMRFILDNGTNSPANPQATVMALDSSGNVGIGTTSPAEKLEVNGNIKFSNGALLDSQTVIGSGVNDLTISTPDHLKLDPGYGDLQVTSGIAMNGGLSTGGRGEKIVFGGGEDYLMSSNTDNDVLLSSWKHIRFGAGSGVGESNFSEKMRITSSGNVGIGTTSPSEKLHVEGDIRLLDELIFGEYSTTTDRITNQSYALTIAHSDSINFKVGTASVFNVYGTQIRPQVNDTVDLGHSGFRWKRGFFDDNILTNGSIGIGTDYPSTPIHIEASDPRIKIVDTDGTNWESQVFTQGGALKLQARNGTNFGNISFQGDNGTTQSEYARFNSVGSFGIGTTSPSEKLHVLGYVKTSIGLKAGNYTILNESSNETSLGNTAYYPMFFKTNNSTRMTISNAGNVGIGTTSPSKKLDVIGDIRALKTTGTASVIAEKDGNFAALNADGTSGFISYGNISNNKVLRIVGNGLEVARFDTSGNVGIGTTSPSAKLHILDNAEQSQVRIGSDASNYLQVDVAGDGDSTISAVGSGFLPPDIKFNTNSSTILTINGTFGNVGIGTSTPSEKLEVDGNVQAETLIATDLTDGYVPYSRNGTVGLQDSEIYHNNNGQVGIGTTTLSQALNVNGDVLADGYRLSAMQTAPSSRGDTGTLGEIRVTADYIYVCYATDSWHRVAITNW